ncbi:MAG: N-acetylmuramoyl-L-alanine amidase [Paludibacteraceae bacterium]|nr:N-acetylmuramoyl-L-alanine amidase [Paludibacteraceae bacterium]
MAKKFFISTFFIFMCACLMAAPYTVVIDAGHGGKDGGAVGRNGVKEKDLNLDVSLRLASKLRTQFPDIQVLLTRSTDVFLPLQQRADFVNQHNANLFICIHTNAADARSAKGTEVYVLGTDRLEQNLDVAMRENAVMKLEADYQTTYHGFDPNSVESYIMFELMQNQYIDQSLQFATLVQNQFVQTLHRDNRGVHQAAFWVLLKSACPSVLVEMGFVSNADEEKYLNSDQGKREITESIFNAFCAYYKPTSTPSPVLEQKPVQENENQPVMVAPVISEKEPEKVLEKSALNQGHWCVQILAGRSRLSSTDPCFKSLSDISYREVNGLYKYMVGHCATKQEAVELRDRIKNKFPDCFVVYYE